MMSILWIFRQESKMKRKERLRYYSLYTVFFAVLSFLVFFIFIKNGRSFVYESNGEDGIAPAFNNPALSIVWGFVQPLLDADEKRYKDRCKKARESICL